MTRHPDCRPSLAPRAAGATRLAWRSVLAAAALGPALALAQSTAPLPTDPHPAPAHPPSTSPAASTASPHDGARRQSLAGADKAFLEQAAEDGLTEIEGSRLALNKVTDPSVKRFAQRLVDEHTRMADDLRTLARQKGVKLPQRPSLLQRGKLKLLSTADGDNFTHRYLEHFGVDAHEDTLERFEKAADSAKDPEVKAFAAHALPALRQHLDEARRLAPTRADQRAPTSPSRDTR